MRAPVARTLLRPHEALLLRYREAKQRAAPLSSLLSDLLPPLFKSCALAQSLTLGTLLHADAIKTASSSRTSTTNSIISFYIKCGMLGSAAALFGAAPNRDSVTWNAMIHGFFTGHGDPAPGLGLFARARVHGFKPNVSTIVLAIQGCWKLQDVEEGLNVHGFAVKIGFLQDVSIRNSLLSLYGRFGDLGSAQKLFDEMGERDVVSWSALIGAYAQSERSVRSLELFKEMCSERGFEVDGLSIVSVLQGCGCVGEINYARPIHGLIIRKGFETDQFVANSLVDMYSKCLDVDSACVVFDIMGQRNLVSWNSMLSGFVHSERCLEALELFDSMKRVGIEGDEVTLVTMLQMCKKLEQGIWCECIHAVVIRKLFLSNILLLNSLLDAYAKCGLIDPALKLFEEMNERNAITWSTIVAGCAHCGKPYEAIRFFNEMRQEVEKPNSVTILSLLESCASLAELKLSKCAHGVVIRNYLASELAVGTAIVDMYAKCGDLDFARKVFAVMPVRNVITWNAMIGALGMNGHGEEALFFLNKMRLGKVEPNEVTMLAVLSACSHGGLVKEGLSCFKRMVIDHSLEPGLEHFSCIIDMLARSGEIKRAMEIIENLPKGIKAGPAAWGALLSACRSYGKCELGRGAASRVLELEPSNSAGYLLTSSMFAKDGLADDSARMRLLMKEKGVKVMSAYSLVHVGGNAHKFVSWDGSHPEIREIYSMVKLLHCCIKRIEQDCLLIT